MAHRYKDVYIELLEMVPELGLTYGPEYKGRDWEWTMEKAGQVLSQEDKAYLLSVEANNGPSPKTEEPLLYDIFEIQLRPLLISYSQQPSHFARLAAIMDWLEELANDGDEKTSTLVAIGICEGLITNHSAYFAHIFPFIGNTMRQMCRDFIPFFRVNEEIKTLLASNK